MGKTSLILGASFLVLAACGNEAAQNYDKMSVAESRMASPAPPPPPPPPPSPSGEMATDSSYSDLPQQGGLFLAYTYGRTISVPTDGMKDLLDKHAQACFSAGPRECLVTNSSVNGIGTDYANGYLNLKGSPAWTRSFLDALPDALKEGGASITESNTNAVDLTTQIIDTDAQLKAQKTLRDRLQKLLETRDGNLEELLGVERELARVQASIDSYASTLENLKQRVSMSNINLYYQAKTSPVSQSVWRPLSDAFDDFFYNIAGALGVIVTLLAILLPWIPVVLGLGWLGRFLWTRRSKKKVKAE